MPSTSFTIASIELSTIEEARAGSAFQRLSTRSAASRIGVSGFLSSWASRWAMSFQASNFSLRSSSERERSISSEHPVERGDEASGLVAGLHDEPDAEVARRRRAASPPRGSRGAPRRGRRRRVPRRAASRRRGRTRKPYSRPSRRRPLRREGREEILRVRTAEPRSAAPLSRPSGRRRLRTAKAARYPGRAAGRRSG